MATLDDLSAQVASHARALNSRVPAGGGSSSLSETPLSITPVTSQAPQLFTVSELVAHTLTVDLNSGYLVNVKLDANATIAAPTNVPAKGNIVYVLFEQDSTGGRTVTWNAAWGVTRYIPRKGPGGVSTFWFVSTGTAFTLMAASAIDITAPVDVVDGYGCRYSGNNYVGVLASTAIQAAIDDGYDLYLPAGSYPITKPIWVKRQGQRIVGAGKRVTEIRGGGFSGAGIFFCPQYQNGGLPTTTQLATGTGAAAVFTGGGFPYYLGLSDNPRIDLDGKSAFTVDFYIRVDGSSGANNSILSCGGKREVGSTSIGTFSIGHSIPSLGKSQIGGSCHIGGVAVNFSSGATQLTVGTVYHVEVSYDGAHVRTFVGGVLAESIAATGTVDQPTYACWNIGASTANMFEANIQTASPYCTLDSIRISEVARHTAAFTPPTAKFTFDSSTLFLHNFDNEQGQFSVAKSRSANNVTALDHYILLRRTDESLYGGAQGAGLYNLWWHDTNIEGCGIYLRWVTDFTLQDCVFTCSVNFADNAYKQNIIDCTINPHGGTRFGLMFGNASGVFVVERLRVTGGKYGVATLASGGKFGSLSLELNSDSEVGLFTDSGTITVENISIDDETASSPKFDAAVIISEPDVYRMTGGNMDVSSYEAPPIIVSGGTRIILDGVAFRVHSNSQEVVSQGAIAPTNPVQEYGSTIYGVASSAPWSDTVGLVVHGQVS